jgi:hypothetical protein
MLHPYGSYDCTELISSTPVQKRKKGNQCSRHNQWYYKDLICAFDIETSLIRTGSGTSDYISVMYIWQLQLGKDCTIYGRTWDDFLQQMSQITNALEPDERLFIAVHNLAYEWQWLRDPKLLGSVIDESSVFLVDSRRPLKFNAYDGKIEFRCSYLHSNMSLDEFTDKMHVEHGKLSGKEFDYSKLRYPWTALTDRELEYCANDVIGLVECLYKECEIDHDTLYTLPLPVQAM